MDTATIVQQLIALCSKGNFLEAQDALYHTDILSIESDGTQTLGAANMRAKETLFLSRIEQMSHISYSDVQVAGSYFSVVLRMTFTLRDKGPVSLEEVCVYRVKEGKIVFEQFFRD